MEIKPVSSKNCVIIPAHNNSSIVIVSCSIMGDPEQGTTRANARKQLLSQATLDPSDNIAASDSISQVGSACSRASRASRASHRSSRSQGSAVTPQSKAQLRLERNTYAIQIASQERICKMENDKMKLEMEKEKRALEIDKTKLELDQKLERQELQTQMELVHME